MSLFCGIFEKFKNCFVHTVEIKGNQKDLVTFYKIFILCSTHLSRLERHEGDRMMTEFINRKSSAV